MGLEPEDRINVQQINFVNLSQGAAPEFKNTGAEIGVQNAFSEVSGMESGRDIKVLDHEQEFTIPDRFLKGNQEQIQGEDLDAVATKIQAAIRGRLTRKQILKLKLEGIAKTGSPVKSMNTISHASLDNALLARGSSIGATFPSQEILPQNWEQSVIKSQALVRGKLARKKVDQMRQAQQDREAELSMKSAKLSNPLKREASVSEKEIASTVKIQAAIRGRILRQKLKPSEYHGFYPKNIPETQDGMDNTRTALKVELKPPSEDLSTQIQKADSEEASAAKIQAIFRGHLARKHLYLANGRQNIYIQ